MPVVFVISLLLPRLGVHDRLICVHRYFSEPPEAPAEASTSQPEPTQHTQSDHNIHRPKLAEVPGATPSEDPRSTWLVVLVQFRSALEYRACPKGLFKCPEHLRFLYAERMFMSHSKAWLCLASIHHPPQLLTGNLSCRSNHVPIHCDAPQFDAGCTCCYAMLLSIKFTEAMQVLLIVKVCSLLI